MYVCDYSLTNFFPAILFILVFILQYLICLLPHACVYTHTHMLCVYAQYSAFLNTPCTWTISFFQIAASGMLFTRLIGTVYTSSVHVYHVYTTCIYTYTQHVCMCKLPLAIPTKLCYDACVYDAMYTIHTYTPIVCMCYVYTCVCIGVYLYVSLHLFCCCS